MVGRLMVGFKTSIKVATNILLGIFLAFAIFRPRWLSCLRKHKGQTEPFACRGQPPIGNNVLGPQSSDIIRFSRDVWAGALSCAGHRPLSR